MGRNRTVVVAGVLLSVAMLGFPAAKARAFQNGSQGHGQSDKGQKAGPKQAKKAQKRDDKKDKSDDKKDASKDDRRDAVAVDRDGHVRVIRDYGRGGSLPPGLAKRESLPPGLRAQLRERGTLPPGLQKRLVLVPAPLGARLPPVPPYYRRYFAGDDLIVVDTRTNLIAVLIRDVWR